MKYLITEDRISGLIEKTLKENFPSIYDVSFRTFLVGLGTPVIENGKYVTEIQRNNIQIIINPLVQTGGLNWDKNYMAISRIERKKIFDFIQNYLPIDVSTYASNWGVEFYYLEPKTF